ncbi:Hypothetical predicted protein, partial [Pelobates cultripes]
MVDEDSAPTTKGDLKYLLHELRIMYQADCTRIHEEMHTLSSHIKAVEDKSVTARQAKLNTALLTQQLTQQHVALTPQVAGLEDTLRQRNLKIR